VFVQSVPTLSNVTVVAHPPLVDAALVPVKAPAAPYFQSTKLSSYQKALNPDPLIVYFPANTIYNYQAV